MSLLVLRGRGKRVIQSEAPHPSRSCRGRATRRLLSRSYFFVFLVAIAFLVNLSRANDRRRIVLQQYMQSTNDCEFNYSCDATQRSHLSPSSHLTPRPGQSLTTLSTRRIALWIYATLQTAQLLLSCVLDLQTRHRAHLLSQEIGGARSSVTSVSKHVSLSIEPNAPHPKNSQNHLAARILRLLLSNLPRAYRPKVSLLIDRLGSTENRRRRRNQLTFHYELRSISATRADERLTH